MLELSTKELNLLIPLVQQAHAQAFLANPSKLQEIDSLLGKLTVARQELKS